MIQTLDEADDQPIGLATSYYPAARFNGLLERLGDGSQISDILRHFGVADFVRAKSCITTQMPSEETARLLKQSVLRPLLCVENLDVDMNCVPVKYGETLFCGDRVQLAVTTGENS
jgi:GntR family phosphonate transport system transcriptional regulator